MNYFVYPMKYMRITQSYSGAASHKLHWYNSKNYKDYPIDDGGRDSGRDGIYCPCDEMVVTQIKGVGNNKITNTIWLVSTTKVKTPTFNDYAFMTLTHSNDSDFKNIRVGTKFKRGQLIVNEGTNVNVPNHIHMTFGRGSSNNWITNSNKKIVIKGNTKKPEEVCYVDTDFTIIKNTGGIKWVTKPVNIGTPISRDTTKDQLKINASNLRARETPDGKILGYVNVGTYNILDTKTTNKYTWYKIDYFWVAYSSDWATLLKKEIKNPTPPKEDNNSSKDNNDDVPKNEEVPNKDKKRRNIFTIIIEFIKKLFKL